MELKELGTLFREERIRQGLSIEEVMDRTKISKRVLLGLEEGRAEDLPHAVYAKGLIRNYARLLGLDEEGLCRHFSEIHPDLWAPLEVEQEMDASMPVASSTDSNRSGLLLAVVALAVAGAGFWAVVTFWEPVMSMFSGAPAPPVAESTEGPGQADSAPEAAVEPAESEKSGAAGELGTSEATREAGQSALSAVSASAPVADDVEEVDVATAPEQDVPAGEPQIEATPSPVADVETETEPEAVAEVPSVQVLEIRAVADCWIRATPDGGGKKDLLLKKGRSVSFEFKESIELRLGNAGGVRFSLNGEPYAYTSKSGAVATVTIP